MYFAKYYVFQDYTSKLKSRCETMHQTVRTQLVKWIVTTLTDCHGVSPVISQLLRLLRINSSRSDLRGHVTDGKTQFLPSVSFHWLVGLGVN